MDQHPTPRGSTRRMETKTEVSPSMVDMTDAIRRSWAGSKSSQVGHEARTATPLSTLDRELTARRLEPDFVEFVLEEVRRQMGIDEGHLQVRVTQDALQSKDVAAGHDIVAGHRVP